MRTPPISTQQFEVTAPASGRITGVDCRRLARAAKLAGLEHSDSSNAQGVGASGYAGTSPQTAGKFSQKAYGLYVGLETDLTEALTVGAAGRYEHYNTFGDAWVGKVNALYKFAEAFSMRGSVGFPASLTQNLTTGCTIVLNRSAVELIATSVPPPVTLHDWWCYLVVSAAGGRPVGQHGLQALGLLAQAKEIGRASCRERV